MAAAVLVAARKMEQNELKASVRLHSARKEAFYGVWSRFRGRQQWRYSKLCAMALLLLCGASGINYCFNSENLEWNYSFAVKIHHQLILRFG